MRRNWELVLGLGLTMVVGYGAIYYAFTVTAPAIAGEFGWSNSFTYGSLSLALLAGGAISPRVGRLLDRAGVRLPMTLGSVAAAVSLVALAFAAGPVTYVGALILVELSATLVLYEAAFTGITQIAGPDARRIMTSITLIAGFASTIFWPLTTSLMESFTWRETYLIYAAVLLAVCAPVHFLCLRDARGAPSPPAAAAAPVAASPWRDPTFALLAISFCLGSFVLSSFPVYVLGILGALGTSPGDAIWVAALIGPSQVAARFLEMVGGRGWNATTVGLIAAGALPLALLLVLGSGSDVAFAVGFAVLFGIGQGLTTIARGIVPLALFGSAGYGTLTGRLSSLRLIVSALAPLAFAALVDGLGTRAALLVAMVFALGSLGTYLALLRRLAPRPILT